MSIKVEIIKFFEEQGYDFADTTLTLNELLDSLIEEFDGVPVDAKEILDLTDCGNCQIIDNCTKRECWKEYFRQKAE